METEIKAVVSAILIRNNADKKEKEVFIQTRWKPEVSPAYSGMIEIPAGVIKPYENVYDALRREVKEECGLEITKIIDDYQTRVLEHENRDKFFAFKPFICQQILKSENGLPWIGFVFLCETKGDVKTDPAEVKDPKWVTISELKEMLQTKPEIFFPLQLPVLKYFLDYITLA
ncbi:MAG: ADP-ribose pyrophosphatase [Parcubacteria group bacterium Licking1014_17]|nr:MAG: ADP-ribose pyrophosphatase [Parcubacteria group bacterium Licking1014_17]